MPNMKYISYGSKVIAKVKVLQRIDKQEKIHRPLRIQFLGRKIKNFNWKIVYLWKYKKYSLRNHDNKRKYGYMNMKFKFNI